MGVKERRAREKEDLRQEILDAARELFVRDGYEAVSMRKIADKIEYSPTTIYLYFRDKSELFDCLSTEAFGKLLAKLQSIRGESSASEDAVESLRRGLLAYIEFGLENPDHYKITFLMEERAAGRREVGCQSFECLRMAVGACIQAGRFRVLDEELASQLLWAGVHGLTSLLIVHPEFPWVDRTTLTLGIIDTLMEGLLI
jgi:AcrR family transcriptional regulator